MASGVAVEGSGEGCESHPALWHHDQGDALGWGGIPVTSIDQQSDGTTRNSLGHMLVAIGVRTSDSYKETARFNSPRVIRDPVDRAIERPHAT